MTIEEMKNLKLGDIFQDLELLENLNKKINCLVVKVEDDRIYAIAIDSKDESRYPHSFRFNEKDSKKISLPINNINKNIYDLIFNNFRSIESFSKKVYKWTK